MATRPTTGTLSDRRTRPGRWCSLRSCCPPSSRRPPPLRERSTSTGPRESPSSSSGTGGCRTSSPSSGEARRPPLPTPPLPTPPPPRPPTAAPPPPCSAIDEARACSRAAPCPGCRTADATPRSLSTHATSSLERGASPPPRGSARASREDSTAAASATMRCESCSCLDWQWRSRSATLTSRSSSRARKSSQLEWRAEATRAAVCCCAACRSCSAWKPVSWTGQKRLGSGLCASARDQSASSEAAKAAARFACSSCAVGGASVPSAASVDRSSKKTCLKEHMR
mmetsp:Transcript_19340/g.63884  ORF Transcript_19340/g.63884 Transcript_19340/m.63884 type:complete len:283 (+) Transcript_19340:794-1642(+)